MLWGDAGDDTLTHIEGGTGATVLNGGLGHDTLTGQSGDTFRGGEDITVNVTAPLEPDTSHATTVWYDDGYNTSDPTNLDPSGAPFDSSFEDGTLTLNFPEGTTGTLHIVNEQANGADGRTGERYSINQAYIYYVPEGETFDPDDLDNATQVANLRLDILRASSAHDPYTFPDYDSYLTSDLSVGSVHNVTVETEEWTFSHISTRA